MNSTDSKNIITAYILTVATTVLWGWLPLVLKVVLVDYSAQFLSLLRFFLALLLLVGYLRLRKEKSLGAILSINKAEVFAGLALAANYYCFIEGIHQAGASTASILIQSGCVFLLLIGVILFKERFSKVQISGLVFATCGFIFFYQSMLAAKGVFLNLGYGSVLILLAGLFWAIYTAILKHSEHSLKGHQLNVIVFSIGSVCFLPAFDVSLLGSLDTNMCFLILFLGFITFFGYSALAEALQALPASTVSVLLATAPIITLVTLEVLIMLGYKNFDAEHPGLQAYIGAAMVICGVVLVVCRKRKIEEIYVS